MENYREMLRQALLKTASCNAIAKSRGISHNTVRRATRLAEAAGVTPENIDQMTDTDLRAIVYPGRQNQQYIYPDWDREISYLELGHTKTEAHARYMDEVGTSAALGYSAYCERLKKYQKGLALEFRHIHQPGYAMQIDPAGYRPVGIENKVVRKFQLFVTIMPASSKYFAIAIRSQCTSDIIEATIAALEYYGGVPETLCSDNLKAVVIGHKPNREPIINPAYLAFADYYEMRVTPARVYKPKDKGAVENAVKHIQRHLRIRLNSRPRMDLAGINHLLREIVEGLNAKTMKRGGENRNQRFDRIDKPFLKPLPKERIEFITPPEQRRVPPDHHISFEKVKYSVPYTLVDKLVSVRASSRTIEIRYDGQPVAIHRRSYDTGDGVTIDAHVPKNHKTFIRMRFSEWKSNLPSYAEAIVDSEVNGAIYLNRNKLMGRVRRIIRDYGLERFERACSRAIQNSSPTLTHVTNLLVNNLEEVVIPFKPKRAAPTIEPQQNVRGSGYFNQDLDKKGGAK